MTIKAESAGGENIRLLITEGPVDIEVVENYASLRTFWNQLGVVLNEVEHTT
jgi:hypothetical protein